MLNLKKTKNGFPEGTLNYFPIKEPRTFNFPIRALRAHIGHSLKTWPSPFSVMSNRANCYQCPSLGFTAILTTNTDRRKSIKTNVVEYKLKKITKLRSENTNVNAMSRTTVRTDARTPRPSWGHEPQKIRGGGGDGGGGGDKGQEN